MERVLRWWAMRLGVNVPNFGPGTRPDVLRAWARMIEELGYDLLMVSDHVVITPDVAARYPAPFYEPFTTLSWLAAHTDRVQLGTTVLLAPYRHPLLVARMAANLAQLSDGRLILGIGVGWARQEFEALGVPFSQRGRLTDRHVRALRAAWSDDADYGGVSIPIWIGGNSEAAMRRAVSLGDGWHPIRLTMEAMHDAVGRLRTIAGDRGVPAFVPRIALQLRDEPVDAPSRPAGVGTIDQVTRDLDDLRSLGADTVLLDPFNGDPAETLHPEVAWEALAAAMDAARRSADDR